MNLLTAAHFNFKSRFDVIVDFVPVRINMTDQYNYNHYILIIIHTKIYILMVLQL